MFNPFPFTLKDFTSVFFLFQLPKKQNSIKKIFLPGKVIVPLLMLLFLCSTAKATNYYTWRNGNPTSTRSWFTGTNGTGSRPRNFNNAADIFIIQNNNSMTANRNWTVAGSVIINSGCILTATGGNMVLGLLIINSGGTLNMNRPMTVDGTTNISGTVNFGSTNTSAQAMAFNGPVILNNGATWAEPATGNGANNTYNFANNFTNNATAFNAFGTGVHTFSGTGKTMSGNTNTAIQNVAIIGTITNLGTLTVSTALTGNGTLTNSTTGILNYGGTSAIAPTLAATADGNTINYFGAAQTAKVTTYSNLILSGSGVKTFATTPTINGMLSLEGTASVVVSTGVVTYGSAATLQYNKTSAYLATTEEWISPFTATGGIIITNTGTITAPAGRTIGNGSSLNLQNGSLVAGTNISMASTSTINRSEGSMTGIPQGAGIYNVNYTGNAKSTGPELSGSGLNNVSVNLAASTTALTSSASAFTAGNNLTVTHGNLILQATNANYTVNNDLIVSSNGTLTHSVYWDGTNKLLRVNGNIAIDGKFAYTVRSHVQMGGVNKTIRTGPAPSALSILTLAHTSGTISASGLVTVNDNFWASFNAIGGTFATSTYTVYAKAVLLNAGGTILINGGTLNVTGGLLVGTSFTNGSVTLNSGALNSDFISVGDGTRTGIYTQSGGTANVTGNLTINPSCSYICSNSPTINIGGNFVNNGTYTKGAETVTFSGTTASSLSGSSNTLLNNMSVNNTAGVTTQLGLLTTNNLTITSGGRFTIDPQKQVTVNGALTLNDSIILKSSSAGTASLVTKGSVTGSKARVERYIGGVSWSWHFLSAPVTAQPISGGFTPSATGYDFYTWYEPQLTWVNVKNTTTAPTWNFSNGNTNFLPGRGYLVAYEATNSTKNFTGALNSGPVSYPLTSSGTSTFQYFNLVGNPYPCSIDWEASSGWDRSQLNGIQKSFWVWNDAAGNYGAYITGSYGFGTNGVTNYISSGQGYMVLAETAGSFTLDDRVKTHSVQNYLKSEKIINEEIRLKLSCDVNAYSDEAIIAFNSSNPEEGSLKFNSMFANAPELWSVKNGTNYSINFIDQNYDIILPLTVKAGASGNYTLTASQVESFDINSNVSLEDRAVGSYTNFSSTPSYTFSVSEQGTITDRFFLHFMDVTGIPNSELAKDFKIYASDGMLNISSIQQLGGKIAVFDMLGRTIASGRIESGSTTQINMQGNTGVYIVSVITGKRIRNTKILIK